MAFIINIRKRKWLVNGFAIGSIMLLFITLTPGFYQGLTEKFHYIGVINGTRVYQSEYEQALEKTRGLYADISESEVHKKTWLEMVKEKTISSMATALSISVDTKEANLEITSYSNLTKKVLKENGNYQLLARRFAEIKKTNKDMTDQDAFLSFIRTKDGKSYIEKQLRPKVIAKLLETRIKEVLGSDNHFKHNFDFKPDTGKKITYYTIKNSQLPIGDEDVTEEEKQQYWRDHQDEYKDTSVVKVAYLLFPVLTSPEQQNHLKTTLNSKCNAFKKSEKPKSYARKNSDEPNNLVKQWRKEEVPSNIEKLEEGEVSDVIMTAHNQGVIYRRMKDEGPTIKCLQIVKKSPLNKKKNEAKRKADYFLKQVEKTSWKAQTEEKGLTLEEVLVTPDIANFTLGETTLLAKISKEVFEKKIYRGNTFLVEIPEGYAVAYIEKKVNGKTWQAQEKGIIAKLKDQIRVYEVKNKIEKNTLAELIEQKTYGTLKAGGGLLTFNSEQIGGESCPKDIFHILNQHVEDPPHVFCANEKIFIVKVIEDISNPIQSFPSRPNPTGLDYNKISHVKDYRFTYKKNN
ncbi:MAG: SurA N-terminal domain-containing protein [Cytophagales bacterium]